MSRDRAPNWKIADLTTGIIREAVNPNQKIYHEVPDIGEKDLIEAYKWNSRNKQIVHIGNCYFMKRGHYGELAKTECKQFKEVLDKKRSTFDEMIAEIICNLYLK